ncbi:MAG: AAA family ATPase, partial [Methanobrevibacter sp.]|nr:AAA family ATPase [Candidatus Methanoflexus mossambicus]
MSLLPTGNPSFKKMIENDYVYVDKTKYIYDLITKETTCFLSRPRRFGKSLLIDTMYELFNGNKDLFK